LWQITKLSCNRELIEFVCASTVRAKAGKAPDRELTGERQPAVNLADKHRQLDHSTVGHVDKLK